MTGPSRRTVLTAAAGGALVSPLRAAAQSEAAAADFLRPQMFGAVADGTADCTEAIQRAVDAGLESGRPLFFPAGAYRVRRPIRIRVDRFFPHAGAFGRGIRIVGAGLGATVFDSEVADGALFDVDSAADHNALFRAVLGCRFEGFTIRGTRGVPRSTGIKLRTAFQVRLHDLHIAGMTGDGVAIECLMGDNDGSNMVNLKHVRIENCAGWGVAAAAAPGHHEISFVLLEQVMIQYCGTRSQAAVPASGGMIWKGQGGMLVQTGFTLNANCALFIPGEAGLAQSIDLQGTVFENNFGRHLLCTGIDVFKGRNLQFYSYDGATVDTACEFDGSRHPVRVVDIDGVAVRATRGNRPYTAFRIGGAFAELDSCRVRNVAWENFDYPGQHRFDGWLFDSIRQCCRLRVISPSEAVFGPHGEGNTSPLRLRGGVGGAPSGTGEWVEATMGNGLVLSSSGLAPGQTYNIYLYDDVGVKRLEAVGTAQMLDPGSGYLVREDDRTRLFVGQLRTGPGGGFVD